MRLYKERLYWHVRKIVLNHDDADDVLQNTFIKVFRSIDRFEAQSKLYTWVYRIATNEALSFIRKRSKLQGIPMEEVQQQAAAQLSSDPYFNGDRAQLQLQRAIAELPSRQQLVFNMKYFEEMKYREIADVLETSEGSLKASYHHAVKKIKQYLEQHP
ncbi:RNA polymerase sigma factor [Flavobacteriaceae bacterium YJPT1-3]|nr:RNA polymerase sigma factor [Flavobacteriaceae bacterium YJPT1-3]